MDKNMRKAIKDYALSRFADVSHYLAKQAGFKAQLNYRKEHCLTVAGLAKTLARQLQADEDICWTAGLLHDLGKCYDFSLSATENERRRKDHGYYGALEAQEFLTDLGLPQYFIEEVYAAIAQHVGLTRSSKAPLRPLAAAITWDADKLSKIGFTTWLHYLADRFSRPGEETDLVTLIDDHHNFATMEMIIANFNTVPARQMAVKRLEKYKKQLERIRMELVGLI